MSGAQETFLIIIDVEKSFLRIKICGNCNNTIIQKYGLSKGFGWGHSAVSLKYF